MQDHLRPDLADLIGPEHAAHLQSIANKLPEDQRESWLAEMVSYLDNSDRSLSSSVQYRFPPVSLREFVESKYYLDKRNDVYPVVMDELEEINSGDYDEAILTGGIGAAKTTIALYTQAYQLYLISCMNNPHGVFGLDRSSEIKFVFQNINKNLARGVDYQRFRSMISQSTYFRQHFPFDEGLESAMKFPNRVEVEPVAGTETAAIGSNVIGGIIDEVNFMSVVKESKHSTDGSAYDQATVLYNTIARRRKSRFLKNGKMPGLLCLVSSKKTPGQFTDKKIEEAKTNPRIYVYDKRVWDIKPEGTYTQGWFHVFVGDESRQPRILKQEEQVADADRHMIDTIPMEYLEDFKNDITKSLRDIAGRSTLAIHPFMANRQGVVQCFGKRHNIFAQDVIDFSLEKVQIRTALLKHNPECFRWAHIDLGLTSDSAGLVIGHCPGFREVKRGEDAIEILPIIELDGVLEIVPARYDGQGEIDFASIRRILYRLRDLGLLIKWITMDSYQSADSMQILRQQGFTVGHQSVDTEMIPYDLTKQALYDGRLIIPRHEKLLKEFTALERDLKKGKIDHPPHGSKDVADAAAGVVMGLTCRREIWAQHRVPIHQANSVAALMREREQEMRSEAARPSA